ncbi:response regulator transcription factor [Pontiellaceae bacterium B12227]|nr:response regulator transcription factor [Pontiellaceae bacterium B12227]
MKQKIAVMLVEDNPEYREVINLALEDEADIDLISQFGTSEIALRSLQDMSTRRVPDMVLLDLRLPGMDGLDSLPYFKSALPDAKIMILTQSDDESDVLRAISRGASGYLLKSSKLDQITDGIRSVMAGGASLDSGVARFILDTLQNNMPKDEVENMLTPRELEILTLLGEGLVKKEIAVKLGISYTTVDTHVAHIYEKLEVRNAPSAINKAHRIGLFPPAE